MYIYNVDCQNSSYSVRVFWFFRLKIVYLRGGIEKKAGVIISGFGTC